MTKMNAHDDNDVLLNTRQLAERWGLSAQYLANRRSNDKSIPYQVLPTGGVRYRLGDIKLLERMHYVPAPWVELHKALRGTDAISEAQKERLIADLEQRLGKPDA